MYADPLRSVPHNLETHICTCTDQKLGFQGANTLSTVLEENTGLLEIYCENNDINLQGLTVLVNALEHNLTVLYLPTMDRDRADALQTVEREIDLMQAEPVATSASAHLTHRSASSAMRKKITSTVTGKSSSSTANGAAVGPPAYTSQDVAAALAMVRDKWERQATRLQSYLIRNRQLAAGIPAVDLDGADRGENERPDTATTTDTATGGGLAAIMEKARMMTTPTVEKGDGLAAEGLKF